MQTPSPSAETETLLARLSQRPGVQGTLILARETGAIVRSSGLATDADEKAVQDEEAARPSTAEGPDGNPKKGTRKAEEVARLVYRFVQSAGEMAEGLNGEGDEAKLLRIRTRKNEVVVVPDAKFLLVVIHDTPPAP